MYFHYPSWAGSISDPSMVPPPPVVFKTYYFNSEKPSTAKRSRAYMGPFAEDDTGVDYGPEYVRPTPHPPPPPKKEDTFDYWTYTRVYNRPQPFAVPPAPPFPRTRPWGSSTYSKEYRYTQTQPQPQPRPQPQPQPQPQPPHSQSQPRPYPQAPPTASKPRTTWSTPESTKAWRARQKKLWEEWEKKSKENRQSREHTGWDGWAPRSSTSARSKESKSGYRDQGREPRYPSWRAPSFGRWDEGWGPPRAPSPAKSDGGWSGWRDGNWYGRGYFQTGQDEDQSDEDWSEAFWPPPQTERQSRFFTASPSEKKLSDAFASYCKTWATLLSSNDSTLLTFQNIPWPQYPSPRCIEDIDTQNVQAFLKASGRPLKVLFDARQLIST